MISTGIAILTLIIVVGTFLLGLIRGSNRAILRLVLVLLCFVGAFVLRTTVVEMAFTSPMPEEFVSATEDFLNKDKEEDQKIYFTEDQTTFETMLPTVLNGLFDGLGELGEGAIALFKFLVSVLAFLLVFWALRFVSWLIVFQICKIFVKKGKKKHALLGGIFGLLQGVIVAVLVCLPLSALIVNTGDVVSELGGVIGSANSDTSAYEFSFERHAYAEEGELPEEPTDGELPEEPADGANQGGLFDGLGNVVGVFTEYKESQIYQFYDQIGSYTLLKEGGKSVLDMLTEYKDKSTGQVYTFDAQFGAVKGIAKVLNAAMQLNNIDFGSIKDGDISQLQDLFSSLDEMDPEVKKQVGDILTTAATAILPPEMSGLSEALEGIDFENVNFAQEGEAIASIMDLSSKLTATEGEPVEVTSEDISSIIESVSSSNLILPLLDSTLLNTEEGEEPFNLAENMDDELKQAAQDAINALDPEQVSPDNIAILNKLFGFTTEEPTPEEPATEIPAPEVLAE